MEDLLDLTGDTISFHPREETMGMERLIEAVRMREGNLEEAVELMIGAIDTVDSWPKRSGPVKWGGIFATAGTFEKWARDANDQLDRRPPPPMPKTQAQLDAENVGSAIVAVMRYFPHQPTIEWSMLEYPRIKQELRRHVEGLPANEAIALLGSLKTVEDVRAIVGPEPVPKHETVPDAGELF